MISKYQIELWREEFERFPKDFYGGNNLQRDGEGYDSSYVNMKWEMFVDIKANLYDHEPDDRL